MKQEDLALLRRLQRPEGMIDAVLDTDTFNEIDDQFALSYLIRSTERIRVRGLYAAPFFNQHSSGPADGMERSYQEILNLLRLAGRRDLEAVTFRGSERYLPSETEAVDSPAARALIAEAMAHTPEAPLYVVAIGAITNVASAVLLEPAIRERIVIVWLGGHSFEWPNTEEFNMRQDVAAARVVFGCGAAVVQLPCMGVVSSFTTTGPELKEHLAGKNALCDYLVRHTCEEVAAYNTDGIWSRVIWDVTAVGWLMGGDLMEDRIVPSPIPQYDHHYSHDPSRHPAKYVWYINRDALMRDLITKLTK
ncbi:MAG: nucleoside hydrolase [Eubacteriales bacterium]|nr:nucleoside hydrolase [Clostridiales bacterium]MDY3072827.1 nucleoside hydrolase [Eubacteriales bacterium]MDY3285144.1 nucleoside hydrolase [Eubacteriales bacterium]MDY5016801.1 nucleoside hydrolase [Eubacteriales bacterium]